MPLFLKKMPLFFKKMPFFFKKAAFFFKKAAFYLKKKRFFFFFFFFLKKNRSRTTHPTMLKTLKYSKNLFAPLTRGEREKKNVLTKIFFFFFFFFFFFSGATTKAKPFFLRFLLSCEKKKNTKAPIFFFFHLKIASRCLSTPRQNLCGKKKQMDLFFHAKNGTCSIFLELLMRFSTDLNYYVLYF